ncbi:two-component system, OmpR family, phosphate regulon response regulator PhoB [Nitratiruptor sp. YY08-26]|uniref:response regulator transcription factor n=1 Tax=unclassified Nitratiruptor TaxID=2624044 RepID=UPI0019154627|nr:MULTISPECIES: response regulator transcription factor [unclassified Nitratiruptor]BCD62340.1 two-component system, OmpR family, phosphate regulon response regulator PhoB [Nitratiruptor sp. YY08-13]BCD66276.1 two-component system, OmpR family, phosphate regulon response regulator PhoB [Nitratiruptor sp. YY08-26]
MAKPLIVVIEDKEDLLELLEFRLSKEYEVEGFLSTKNVEHFLEEEDVALMLVDRNLPGVEGSEFVKNLRNKGYDIPVIFLTAKDSESDIEMGFMRGGDDYITKPFNFNELLLRIQAVLRRSRPDLFASSLKYRDIELHPSSHKCFIEGKEVQLTKLEFELLSVFLKNRGQVLSRDYLLEHVWRDIKQERSVNVAIKRLKEKIDPKKEKNYIEAVRGVGYKLC